jgi:general secretion pathway protein F
LPTKLLISVTGFINDYLIVFAVSLTLAGFGFYQWVKKSPRGRHFWDDFALRSPLFGKLYQMVLAGRFAKIMGTLLKSGVHMLQSLVIVSSTMKNTTVSDAIVQISKMVERGNDLSLALRETKVFPPYVADMVSVGESSGNIEEMLENISARYEAGVSQRVTALTAMVEPVIILALGVIVGFIMVSILLPLFDMNKLLAK